MTTRPQTHLYTHLVSFPGWFKYTHKQTHTGGHSSWLWSKISHRLVSLSCVTRSYSIYLFPFHSCCPFLFHFSHFLLCHIIFSPFLLYCFLVLFIYLFFAITFPILIPLCGSLSPSILFWDIDRVVVVVLLLCVGCAFLLSVAFTAPPFYRGSKYPLQTVAWQWQW